MKLKTGRTSAKDVLGDAVAVIDLEVDRMKRAQAAGGLDPSDSRQLGDYARTLGNIAAAELRALQDGVGAMTDDEIEKLVEEAVAVLGRRKKKAG